MIIRRPAVAGAFYPAAPDDLRRAIEACYTHPLGPGVLPPSEPQLKGVAACVCPHAGYPYSGPVAAHSYLWLSALRKPGLVVVVGPNHYGIGSGVSTYREGEWETPLGRISIDASASARLVEMTGIVDYDPEAHRKEHSIEVQLPFLQMIYGSFPFLPISMAFQDVDTAREVGRGIAELLRGRGDCILIASSDLTHYEPAETARKKDTALLEPVLALEVERFYAVLEEKRVTACGYGPIATVMEAAKHLGLSGGELHKYATSGDTTGDDSAVVGYSSVSFR